MLKSAKELENCELQARDGDIGSVDEFLFDDQKWTIRYLVINTGSWLLGRRVLISPMSFREAAGGRKIGASLALDVNLTREQMKNSPGIETDKPVSRQWETGFYDYYSFPGYWGGLGAWGSLATPGALALLPLASIDASDRSGSAKPDEQPNEYLRSTKEVTGYRIDLIDGDLGHVEDFMVDDESWEIRYIVVDTQNWWPGRKVLLPPHWIEHVAWPERNVKVNLSREQVRCAPEWQPAKPIDRAYEEKLHSYYGKQGYWAPSN